MEIEAKHINLQNFLKFFRPQSFEDGNKIILEDKDFMLIASILKLTGVMQTKK